MTIVDSRGRFNDDMEEFRIKLASSFQDEANEINIGIDGAMNRAQSASNGIMDDNIRSAREQLEAVDIHSFIKDSILEHTDIKKFRFLTSSLNFQESDASTIVQILSSDKRFTGIRFEARDYKGSMQIRVSWDHIVGLGRYKGTLLDSDRADCTWVGNPLGLNSGETAVLVNTEMLVLMNL